jgi:hypothetical protein
MRTVAFDERIRLPLPAGARQPLGAARRGY